MRDNKGRYTKKSEEGLKVTFYLPSMKNVILLIVLICVLMTWLLIISRMNLIPKLLLKLEEITFPENGNERNGEPEKKNWVILLDY